MTYRRNRNIDARRRCRPGRATSLAAFTLIELLVVVVIVALLLSLLLPALGRARMQAKMTRVHADLRHVTLAVDMYTMDNRDAVPATRIGCSAGVQCQLPPELATGGYLPPPPSTVAVPQAHFPDLFQPAHSYRYVAPGPVWYNGEYFDAPDQPYKPRARVWVPDDFPYCRDAEMTWETNAFGDLPEERPPCPVRYAVWSIGPDPQADKFPRNDWTGAIEEDRFPLLRDYWMLHAGDVGLLTHYVDRAGHVFTSP